MGEGKSAALAWSVFAHTRQNPGAQWYVIRDTWENLRKTTMEEFFKWFPPGVYGSWHETNKEFTWSEGVGKGKVNFLGMDSPDDASKLMSRVMAGFAMDEPAPAIGSVGIDEMIFDLAMTRLRQEGMNWYAAKLAENNPDESHWTWKKFAGPEKKEGFRVWQPMRPENEANLPPGYYANMRATLAHRPDLVRRFIDGEFGFQSEGKAVTPQWSDRVHLASGLIPVRGPDLVLCWDFGLNPTCIITQVTPLGHWNILDAMVGDGMGVTELIQDWAKPLLDSRYPKYRIRHIGDNQGRQREQSSSQNNAVLVLRRVLGGDWRSGPIKTAERVEPLRAVLSRLTAGRGVVQVDKDRATPVWHALRGGWHYHIARTGVVSGEPFKNIHSHPGDAIGYGAALLWPLSKHLGKMNTIKQPAQAHYGWEEHQFRIGPGPSAGATKVLSNQ